MNKMACLFLSDDIFIINLWDDYKSMNDEKILDVITTCIGFNNQTYNTKNTLLSANNKCIIKYKGIIILRNLETFESEYVVIDFYTKKNIIQNIDKLSLESVAAHETNEEFMAMLTELLKKFITDMHLYYNIDYYHSLYDGNEYKSSINQGTKIDLDILIHNYFNIFNKPSIEDLEFM